MWPPRGGNKCTLVPPFLHPLLLMQRGETFVLLTFWRVDDHILRSSSVDPLGEDVVEKDDGKHQHQDGQLPLGLHKWWGSYLEEEEEERYSFAKGYHFFFLFLKLVWSLT